MSNMLAVPDKPDKKQLNLWVSKEIDDTLRELAPKMHLRGRTQVAEVIIESYLRQLKTQTASVPFSAKVVKEKQGTESKKKVGNNK